MKNGLLGGERRPGRKPSRISGEIVFLGNWENKKQTTTTNTNMRPWVVITLMSHQPSACPPSLSINLLCIFLFSSCLTALYSCWSLSTKPYYGVKINKCIFKAVYKKGHPRGCCTSRKQQMWFWLSVCCISTMCKCVECHTAVCKANCPKDLL